MNWDIAKNRPIHLILEDDELEKQLSRLLVNLSRNVKSFKHINNFLSEPLSEVPACLITEINLSDIDGITLIKEIRGHGLATPVIVVANITDGVDLAVQAIQAGAADFIEIPIVERDFLERVSVVLNKNCH